MSRTICSFVLVFLLVAVVGNTVKGQEFRSFDDVNASGTSYNIFAKEGEATVEILVLGSLAGSGIYVVGADVELDELMALMGGTLFAEASDTETTVTVRLFREKAGKRELIYESKMEDMLTSPGLYPSLQDEDLVTVESVTKVRRRVTIFEAVGLLSTIATLVTVITR